MTTNIHYFITGTLVDVEKDVNRPWDPNSDDITISTDSLVGSDDEMKVVFINDNNEWAGGVVIKFSSPIEYHIGWCREYTSLPVSPPTNADKRWRIRYNPAEKRVLCYCNEVEVLNLVLSDSVCNKHSEWRIYYERNPTQAKFLSDDTASDQYCTAGM